MINCPCCSYKTYSACCEPFIIGKQSPQTPEELMRSRYVAYTMANVDYIKATMRGKPLSGFNEIEAARWAKKVNWIKLDVFESFLVNPNKGYVTFEASFVDGLYLKSIHEKSEFWREAGFWYYVDGKHLPSSHTDQPLSQNMKCPCGSPRKFKNCHGAKFSKLS